MRLCEIFIIVLTIVMWIWSVKKPVMGLFYFLVLSITQWYLIFDNLLPLHLERITAIVVFFSWLMQGTTKKKVVSAQGLLLIILFIIMCLSRINAGLGIFTGQYMTDFWKTVILYFLIVNLIDNKEKLKWSLWLVILSCSALAFVTLHRERAVPYWGYWIDKNYFGLIYTAIIGFCGSFIFKSKGLLKKGEAFFYFALLFLAIANGYSRGGYIALGAILLLLFLFNLKIKNIALILPMCFILFWKVPEIAWERLATIKNYEVVDTAQMRFDSWKAALEMIKNNLFLGVGPGEFVNKTFNYMDNPVSVGLNVHNAFLQIGAEVGILGLGVFMLLIFFSIRDAFKVRKINKTYGDGFVISLAGYFIAALFLSAGYYQLLYMLFALVVAARKLAEKGILKESYTEKEILVNPRFEVIFRTATFMLLAYLSLN